MVSQDKRVTVRHKANPAQAKTVTRGEAATIALRANAGFPHHFGRGKDGICAVIRDIGFVQIDTISVVERAHHHILWSRIPDYTHEGIAKLEREKRIFEYWAHAASYLPIEDYRYCLPRMRRVCAQGHDWYRVDKKTTNAVLSRVKAEGPLMARDFEDTRTMKGSWWNRKPEKQALEYLFHAGILTTVTRKGFQKLYDLAERHLPEELDTSFPSKSDMARHYVEAAAKVYGIFARDEIAYQRIEMTEGIDSCLDSMEESGELARIEVEGQKRAYWAKPADIEAARTTKQKDSRFARILSPFDPLIIIRKRALRLFGFDYAIECYLPREKRRFGYFALPVLWRGSFVGMIDAKADRAIKRLVVNRAILNPPESKKTSFNSDFEVELARFASFNGCEEIIAR